MLNGHSDLLGGSVAGSTEMINQIWQKLRNFGGSIDPHQASLVERGIKTLQIRYEKSTETAGKIAEWLEAHPKVKKVIYPGLKSHEDYDLCQKILSGSGNMVSFVVKDGDEAGRKLMNNLNVVSQAISLGGVESLISMPYSTTHAAWSQEDRVNAGIDLGFIRFSTGLEDFDDLKDDFDRSLSLL
jgi:cystathionine beta-lyase/cystathionine gamma-synthase